MPRFACFRWLFWRTRRTLKLLNQVRPWVVVIRELSYDSLLILTYKITVYLKPVYCNGVHSKMIQLTVYTGMLYAG